MTSKIYEKDGELGLKLLEHMNALTLDRHGDLAIKNIHNNMARLEHGQSLAKLRNAPVGEGDTAIVIGGGPSIRRRNPIELIKRYNYKGAIIVTESAMAYCLRNGVVPDLVVTVDPHETRIVRWFGYPHLTADIIRADDYFNRQDLDHYFHEELKSNQELLELIDRHGKEMRIALSTSASEAVVDRVMHTKMDVYWWNPMLDNPDEGGVTEQIQKMNGLPCVNAGGNVGTAAWMMAAEVLGKKKVALTGIDLSYYEGTAYRNTQYYFETLALVGEENMDSVYIKTYNPYDKHWYFSDPAYMWYRNCLLEMAAESECKTFNCTEGGILFGDSIDFIPLQEFFENHV